ncbi:Gtf2a2 [Columba guinea]|nr:Gtf2a2 [Columba guinea]
MAYQLYRNTTLGNSLQESLDELIQSQQITPQLALQVLLQFDKAINSALAQRVRNRVNFRIISLVFLKGSLNTYRFCDNVWTFVLNDVEFREVTELVKVDKVKIVACDGKSWGSSYPPNTFAGAQKVLRERNYLDLLTDIHLTDEFSFDVIS